MSQPYPEIYFDPCPELPEAAPGKGPYSADYAFVGIAPSTNRPEARMNEPFGARSWELMGQITNGHSVYITNLIKVPMKPGEAPALQSMRAYYPRLKQELFSMNIQKRILALGAAPSEVLCPGYSELREDHGTLFYNPDLSLWTMATYHPSAVARNPEIEREFAHDLWRFFTLPDPEKPVHEIIQSADHLPLVGGDTVYLDIETTGLEFSDDITAVGVQIRGNPLVYQLRDPTKEQLIDLMSTLRKNESVIIGHNLQFDLVRLCWKTGLAWLRPIEDTLLLAHVAGEPVLSLKHLTTRYTMRPGSRCWGSWDSPEYLSEDVLSTGELHQHFDNTRKEFCSALLGRVLPVISMMQIRGVYIDRNKMAGFRSYYEENIVREVEALNPYATGINWNSPQQVVPVFLEAGIPLKDKTDTGQYSVSEPAILPFREKYELIDKYLKYKESVKDLGFINWYQRNTSEEHPYLHPYLKLHGTETGRLSCTAPNLQQVPRIGPIKQIFVPRFSGGDIGLIDLAQAELRVVALLSGDKALVQALQSSDVHLTIASQVFKKPPDKVTPAERKKSKGITFGLLYGGSPAGLAIKVQSTPQDVQQILFSFFSLFPDLSRWLEMTKKTAIKDGYIETIFGRRRGLKDAIVKEGILGAQRKAINTPVQSVASDIMLLILDGTSRALISSRMKTRPLFLVHDSMLLEMYPGEEEAVAEVVQQAFVNLSVSPLSKMELWPSLPITGELKVASSWAHVESTNESYSPRREYEMDSHKR